MAWAIKSPKHEVCRGLGVQIEPPDVHHQLITPLFFTQLVPRDPFVRKTRKRTFTQPPTLHSNPIADPIFSKLWNWRPQNTAIDGPHLNRFLSQGAMQQMGIREVARILALIAAAIQIICGIIGLILSVGHGFLYFLSAIVAIVGGLWVFGVELPYAKVMNLCGCMTNYLIRGVIWILLAVFGFIGSWVGFIIGAVCLLIAGILYVFIHFGIAS
eukprot:g15034.t1